MTTSENATEYTYFCTAKHPNAPEGCYELNNHDGPHKDDVNYTDPFTWWEPLDLEAQRRELAELSKQGGIDPAYKSPFPPEPFGAIPQWQKDWHYRVADLILEAGFRKEA